jgi:hypothetical protein
MHRIGGEKTKLKKNKKNNQPNSNFFFSSEIGNFNVGGPVNQQNKKKGLSCKIASLGCEHHIPFSQNCELRCRWRESQSQDCGSVYGSSTN